MRCALGAGVRAHRETEMEKPLPGENLTRIEAQERAALITVQSYEVTLDLTAGPETFGSETTVHFTATPGSSTFIDAITRTVHSVTLNGVALDPSDVSDGIRIQLDGLAAENTLTVVADAEYTNTGEGLHRFVDPVDDEVYLYSQFEVPDSRRGNWAGAAGRTPPPARAGRGDRRRSRSGPR